MAVAQVVLMLAEAGINAHQAHVKAAAEEEKRAIDEHIARTAAAHATIKSISFGED